MLSTGTRTDAQRIEAMTAYFRALAAAQDEADR